MAGPADKACACSRQPRTARHASPGATAQRRLPPDRVAALAMKELRLREQRAQPRFRLLLLGAVLSAALAGLSVLVPPWRGAPAPPAPAPTPPPPVAPPVSAAPSIPSDPGPW